MRLIFVRHGEPDYENDCLTPNGREQAESTAKRLSDEPISAVYSSPNGRARQTASYTAKTHGLDVNVLDFMHEIDWGTVTGDDRIKADPLPYDGHPWTLAYRLLTENPEYVGSPKWAEHHYFGDNVCTRFYEKVSGQFDRFLEGYGLVREDGLYRCTRECGDTIALFAHGGSGAVVISHILSLPFPFVLSSMPYGVCSVSIFDFDMKEGKKTIPRIELFNDMRHISSLKVEKLHFDK